MLAHTNLSATQAMYDQLGARLGRSPKSVKVSRAQPHVQSARRSRISQNVWNGRLKKEVDDMKASLG